MMMLIEQSVSVMIVKITPSKTDVAPSAIRGLDWIGWNLRC